MTVATDRDSATNNPHPPPGHTALEAQGLVKIYARRRGPALAGIDLAIPAGSITALVGPNGAGKSTLMKAWVGFEAPTEGHVLVAGHDPFKSRTRVLESLGYIPQSPAIYRDLTVADHVDFAGSLRSSFDPGLARRRLDDLGIPLTVGATKLSGGQQAQVALALVLATRAPILLLDEPLADLDPLARREFLYLLVAGVRESGATAVLTSHVVTDVEQAADRLVVLGGGRKLLDDGVASALKRHGIVKDGPLPEGTRPVASFLGRDEILTLVELDGENRDLVRRATLEELMLGYLAAGRPGLVERIRTGLAGR